MTLFKLQKCICRNLEVTDVDYKENVFRNNIRVCPISTVIVLFKLHIFVCKNNLCIYIYTFNLSCIASSVVQWIGYLTPTWEVGVQFPWQEILFFLFLENLVPWFVQDLHTKLCKNVIQNLWIQHETLCKTNKFTNQYIEKLHITFCKMSINFFATFTQKFCKSHIIYILR